jgi:acyl-CoA synthetase (NDP forming)
MDQMLASGTRAAVIFSSGFAETGTAGAVAQARMGARARKAGMLLLGPNCLGAMNMREKVFATFSPMALGGAEAGALAPVSQSGAFGGYAFSMARDAGLGLGYWITTGNEAGVQVADAIHWLAQDAATRVIFVYIEGCLSTPEYFSPMGVRRISWTTFGGSSCIHTKIAYGPSSSTSSWGSAPARRSASWATRRRTH